MSCSGQLSNLQQPRPSPRAIPGHSTVVCAQPRCDGKSKLKVLSGIQVYSNFLKLWSFKVKSMLSRANGLKENFPMMLFTMMITSEKPNCSTKNFLLQHLLNTQRFLNRNLCLSGTFERNFVRGGGEEGRRKFKLPIFNSSNTRGSPRQGC